MEVLFLLYSPGFSQITPPLQPASGPGGSAYIHQSVTKKKYGTGGTAFWIFEPSDPKPDSANLVVFNHGWGALNPACYGKWLSHLVRKGNIVVFPKWQNDLYALPQDFTPNAVISIKTAVDTLQNGNHVLPRLNNVAYVGYSYGGVISSNLAILADSGGIPSPKALLVCNGGNGNTQEAMLPTYTTMPDIKLLIIAGKNDVVVADTFGRMLFDSAIAVNPLYKNHITQYYDGHGFPAIESTHNEPLSWDSSYYSYDFFDNNWVVNASLVASKTDAVDFFCYWKFSDAITDCAFYGTNCDYAFCNTPEQRFMGNWSDNQPIAELFVETKTPCNSFTGKEVKPDRKFTIFPNPNMGEFTVYRQTEGQPAPLRITIYDVTGDIICIKTLSGKSGTINFSSFSGGIYFLSFESEEGVFYEKIVVR